MSIPHIIITDTFGDWQDTVNDVIDDLNAATANAISNQILRYNDTASFHANNIHTNTIETNTLTVNNSPIIDYLSLDFANIDNNSLTTPRSIYHFLVGNTAHYLPLKVSTIQIANGQLIDNVATEINQYTHNDNSLVTIKALHDYLSGNTLTELNLPLNSSTLQIEDGPVIISIDTNFNSVGDDRLVTSAAVKQHVTDRINGLINGANGAFDTLGEIESAILNNAGTIDTILNNLTTKITKPSFTTANNEFLQWDGNDLIKNTVDLTPYTKKPATFSAAGKYLTWDGNKFVHSDINPNYHLHPQHALLAGNTKQDFSANKLTATKIKNPNYIDADSSSQIQTIYRDKGSVTSPYVYTKVIEAMDEKGTESTGILIGQNGKTSKNESINTDQIGFFTKGYLATTIDENKTLKVKGDIVSEKTVVSTGTTPILKLERPTMTPTGDPYAPIMYPTINIPPGTTSLYSFVAYDDRAEIKNVTFSTPTKYQFSIDMLFQRDQSYIFGAPPITTTSVNLLTLDKTENHGIIGKIGGAVVWTQNNDGIGSGLDADKLGGESYSVYLKRTESINADTLGGNSAGLYWSKLESVNADTVDNKHATDFYLKTDAIDADTLDGKHASDFVLASGSGLDADTLDGKDSSEFALKADTYTKSETDTEIEKIAPIGDRNQLYLIDEDTSNKTVPQWPILETKIAQNATELAGALASGQTLQQVFNKWTRFCHPYNTFDINAWIFDSGTNSIKCTRNTSGYVGFVSRDRFDNYKLSVNLKSTVSDDDVMAVVIAYTKDPDGSEHTLSAIRNHSPGFGPYSWAIVYNYSNGSSYGTTIENGSSAIADGGNWNNYPVGTDIIIERTGDVIEAWTTQANSTTIVPSSKLTINLKEHSNVNLRKFRGKKSYGFAAKSQNDATISNISFENTKPDASDLIFDLVNGDIYEPTTSGSYTLDTSGRTFANEVGYGRMLRDKLTNKLFYYNPYGELHLMANIPLVDPPIIP